jgi:hypothetical protein
LEILATPRIKELVCAEYAMLSMLGGSANPLQGKQASLARISIYNMLHKDFVMSFSYRKVEEARESVKCAGQEWNDLGNNRPLMLGLAGLTTCSDFNRAELS